MIYKIICVRDRAADLYGAPQCVGTTGAAIRGFSDEINRPDDKNSFYLHPDDFDLFELGSFNDEDAEFVILSSPKQLALGRDLKVRS